MEIIDTHAHLDHLDQPEACLQRAAEAGVQTVIAVTVDLASIHKTIALRQSICQPHIYVAFGIHPGNIRTEEVETTCQYIREHIGQAQAIGEIGLDFWYKWVRKDKEKKDEQRRVFGRQLEMAREYDLPAIIHTRGTWREALTMTRAAGLNKALFHWYSGPLDVLDDILAAGYFVSASPALASSPQSREAISRAPIEQTLIETDSPVFFRYRDREGGFTAEPRDVVKTLQAYADLKGIAVSEAGVMLNRNARTFFQLNNDEK